MSCVVVLKIEKTRCRRDVWMYGLKARGLVSVVDKVLQKIEDERKKGGVKKDRQQKFFVSSAQY